MTNRSGRRADAAAWTTQSRQACHSRFAGRIANMDSDDAPSPAVAQSIHRIDRSPTPDDLRIGNWH